jgi:hypothetical protein
MEWRIRGGMIMRKVKEKKVGKIVYESDGKYNVGFFFSEFEIELCQGSLIVLKRACRIYGRLVDLYQLQASSLNYV